MNEFNTNNLKIYELEKLYFEKLLLKIRETNFYLKQEFIQKKFIEINHFKKDCYSTFFVQFLPYLELISTLKMMS